MEYDEDAASVKRAAIRQAAIEAKRAHREVTDQQIEAAIDAFTRVTPPEEPEATIGLITVSSLYDAPTARSRKPGNVLLNWRKLVDIVPDVSLAGLGAATLPIAPAWSAVLAGLYVWNKIWKGSSEDFNDAEAIVILALWKHRNGKNKIAEDEGFKKTNAVRETYSLAPITERQFTSIVNRLVDIECIEVEDGIIWLREWVNIKYR